MNPIIFCTSRKALVSLVATIWVAMLENSSAATRLPELPPEVEISLERLGARIQQITFETVETQSGAATPDYYGGPTLYVSYLETNRFYLTTSYLYRDSKGVRTLHESAYDGIYYYAGDRDNSPTCLEKWLPSDETDPGRRAQVVYPSYLAAAGVRIPRHVAEMSKYDGPSSEVLAGIAEGRIVSVASQDGFVEVTLEIPDLVVELARIKDEEADARRMRKYRNGLKLLAREIPRLRATKAMTQTRQVTYRLASEYDYGCVERTEHTADGRLIVRVICDRWQRIPQRNLWIPGRCTEIYYCERHALANFTDKPRLVVIHQVKRTTVGPREDPCCTLDYTSAGDVIFDRTTPEARAHPDHRVMYTVSADGKRLRDAARSVRTELDRRVRLFWITAIIALIAWPLALRRRRRNGVRGVGVSHIIPLSGGLFFAVGAVVSPTCPAAEPTGTEFHPEAANQLVLDELFELWSGLKRIEIEYRHEPSGATRGLHPAHRVVAAGTPDLF